MFQTLKRVYNSKSLMLYIILFPGLISIITKDTTVQYIKSVVQIFVLVLVFELLLNKITKRSQKWAHKKDCPVRVTVFFSLSIIFEMRANKIYSKNNK